MKNSAVIIFVLSILLIVNLVLIFRPKTSSCTKENFLDFNKSENISRLVNEAVTSVLMSNSTNCTQSINTSQIIEFKNITIKCPKVTISNINQNSNVAPNLTCIQNSVNTADITNKVANEIKQKADNAIKKIRDDFVADHVTKTSSYTADKSLKPEINKMIREQTLAAITTEVQCALTDERERIQKAINELFTRNEKALETFITKKIDAKITEVLSDRLNVMTSHLADLSKYYADELRKQREKENNETRKITLEL